MKPLTYVLLFLSLHAFAQKSDVFRIDSLPPQGVLLDKGWKFHAGNNPNWAKADFDDSAWANIDPTKDIFDLPQLPKTGQIGWLRIKLSIANPNQSALSVSLQQVVASEIYLNGKLIHRIGYLSTDSKQIKAVNPNQFPYSLPATSDSVQTLAVRYAFQPNIRYSTHFGMTNPLFRVTVHPTDEAVLEYANTYNRDQNLNFGAVWVILSLLFFTLYIFFPVRKAHLYFSVYTLLFAISWYLLSSVKSPAFVESFYWRNNASVILETIGYLFMLNAVYATFQYKKGLFYWVLVLSGIVAIFSGALVYGWGWLLFGFFFSNFIDIDITRVSLIAVRQHRRGAWILLAGGICYLVCGFVFSLQFFSIINLGDKLGGLLFDISILSISVAFAVFLAYDFGLTSRVLQQKLKENETLAAEKQQILATENDRLEQQVQERTAELTDKNRELIIEAALEKIRSRSLGMHRSVEIKDVVAILFEKLKDLNLVFDGGAAIHLFTEGSKNAVIWVASPDLSEPSCVQLPYDEQAFENNPIITDLWEAKKTGQSIYNKFYSFDEKNRYFDYVFKYNDFITIPQPVREFIQQTDSYTASFIAKKNSLLGANSWTRQLFSDSDLDVLKRITRVFEQAYIRFLDLQKAEAQAREAQIEVALERVRARAMAMKNTGELAELIDTLQRELAKLDFTINNCIFWIMNEEPPTATWWVAPVNNTSLPESYRMSFSNLPYLNSVLNAWKERIPKWTYKLEGHDKKDMDAYLFTETDLSRFPAEVKRSF